LQLANFDESQHPRDDHGRFAPDTGGSSGSGGVKTKKMSIGHIGDGIHIGDVTVTHKNGKTHVKDSADNVAVFKGILDKKGLVDAMRKRYDVKETSKKTQKAKVLSPAASKLLDAMKENQDHVRKIETSASYRRKLGIPSSYGSHPAYHAAVEKSERLHAKYKQAGGDEKNLIDAGL
jgi:hypothetical protein